jgi:tetratricopeptide (TPR) repeat protein
VRKGWGSVARRGASTVRTGTDHADRTELHEAEKSRRSRTRSDGDDFVPERWVQTDSPGPNNGRATIRPPAHRSVRPPAELPPEIADELATAAGSDWGTLRARITERMAAGIGAFERERFRDASRILKTVVDTVPNAPTPRELLAVSQYHQGYWKAALPNLEAFAALTGSVDQHPVRMDCQRALGRPKRVEALYEELRQGAPDPEVLSEGRLVLAGTRADNGDLTGAVELLVEAGAGRLVRNPAERHLRQWYVLADLMERSGDLAKARELFLRIATADPGAYDVAERLDSLGPPSGSRNSGRRRPPQKQHSGTRSKSGRPGSTHRKSTSPAPDRSSGGR